MLRTGGPVLWRLLTVKWSMTGAKLTSAIIHCALNIIHYSCFLNLATGMLSCSRYLATVRRAML